MGGSGADIHSCDCFFHSLNIQCSFHGGGSLAVPGADEDATRTVALIQHVEFDAIYVTLDTHHKVLKGLYDSHERRGGGVQIHSYLL